MRLSLLSTSAAFAVATAIAAPAMAQEADDQGGITDIVVTAQKKEESLQKAAIAIDAVAADTLMERGIATANDMNKVSPAITINNGGGSNTAIFLRGVGNTTTNNYLDPTVTPSYDGVVMGRSSGAFSAAFFDLQRVEVLKGPQGILYGRNATGGAVNIIPQKPKLGDSAGGFSFTYGNYNALNVQAYANIALGDTSALRLAGMRQVHDAYNRDGSDDLDRTGLRAQFLIEPSDTLSVRLGADFTRVQGVGPGPSYIGNFGPTGFVSAPAGILESEGLNTAAANAYRTSVLGAPGFGFLTPMNRQQSVDFTYWGVNAEVKVETGLGELVVIPAYRSSKGESFFYGPAFNTAFTKEDMHQFSVETRLSGKTGMVDYIVGAFYFDENIKNNNEYNQEFVLPIQRYETGTTSWAAFGQLTFNVTDSLRLKGGARYTHDKKFMDGVINNFITFCGGLPPTTPPGSFAKGCASPTGLPRWPNFLSAADAIGWLKTNGWVSPTATVPVPTTPVIPLANGVGVIQISNAPVNTGGSYSRVTWKVSAEYDLAPDNMVYAAVESGYRAGGFQLAEGNPAYDPEFITAYSIGSKNRFLDNKLQLNLEAFLWKYRDQQIGYFTVDFASGVLINRTANAGRSTIKGFDIDLIAKPTRHTTLSAQVQYLDTKYDSLHLFTAPPRDNIACPFTLMTTSSGAPLLVGGQQAKDFNCSGNPLLFSPKWSVNLGAEQVVPLGGRFELAGSVNTSWRASQWGAFEYLAFEKIPAYWSTDLNLTLRDSEGGWSIGGYVNNLEGDRQMSRPQASPLGFATSTYTAPRTYGIRIAADF